MARPSLTESATLLTTALGTLGLAVGIGVAAWVDLGAERRAIAHRVGVVSELTARRIDAALAEESAGGSLEKLLADLETEPCVLSAAAHPPGEVAPWIWTRETRGEGPLPAPGEVGQVLVPELVVDRRQIDFPAGEGVLVVEGDFAGVAARRTEWWLLAVRTIVLGSVLLYVLAGLLQRSLMRPLGRLVRAVERAARHPRNVRGRSVTRGPAEVLALSDAVGSLLDTLCERDRRMARMHSDFKQVLNTRTAELHERSEELQQSRRAAQDAAGVKAEFLTNMSHEVRTPLNSVIGMTELLLQTELDGEQRSLVEMVQFSGQGLLGILEGVHDLNRIESGELQLQRQEFRPRQVIENAVDFAAQPAHAKGLELASFVHPEVPEVLIGDPNRLRQILGCFLDNALKFTDLGEIITVASIERDAGHAVVLRIATRDTGIGIPEGRRADLFDSFTQVDASTTRRFGGAGLGLALCYQLATLMQGEIGFTSTDGEGSTFWVSVPLERCESSRSEARAASEPLEARILVIQETQAVSDILVWQLHALGCQALAEPSVYQGFETLTRQGRFDLVIIDAGLPGREAFLAALSGQAAFAGTKVVIAAHVCLPERKELAAHPQVCALLRQPIRAQHLEESLRAVMEIDAETVAEGSSQAELEASDLLDSALRQRIRLLVVEDNPNNQHLLQYLLGKRGYRVDVAPNGRKAVEACAETSYDALLMDCQMPEMDGFEATRRIRGLEQTSGNRVPILAMTANALSGDRERCLEAGMDDYVTKPIQPQQCIAWLEGWLLTSIRGGREPAPLEEPVEVDPEALDADVLGCLMQDDDPEGQELARELIEHYLEHAAETFLGLADAVAEGDWERVASVAHGLVSSCGTVGAVRFAEGLRRIESTVRSGSEDVQEPLEEAERQLKLSVVALRELVR